jgi:hypothetical protein
MLVVQAAYLAVSPDIYMVTCSRYTIVPCVTNECIPLALISLCLLCKQ